MKISPRETERFIQRPSEDCAVVLLYGPDVGLVKERSTALSNSKLTDAADPFGKVGLSVAQVIDDNSLLAAERSALSFGGGQRVIRVTDAGDRIVKSVEEACDAPGDGFIILEAGELTPRSKLRKFCEASDKAAAIACYIDDQQALGSVIEKTLLEHGLTILPPARLHLQENLGNDRLVSRQELAKLVLYMCKSENREVSLEDAQACIGGNDLRGLADLSQAVVTGQSRETIDIFASILEGGIHAVAVLRGLQRYFHRLHILVAEVRDGQSAEQAVSNLRPPVFFKEKPQYVAAAKKFTLAKVSTAIDLLTEAERACKSGKGPDLSICERALLRVAMLGR